jgi:CheY-like chemotaxis protein
MQTQYYPDAMIGAHSSTRRRVLIVEDDEIACQALRALLHRWGWESSECMTTLSAFDEVRRETPPCVLLDLMMPDMSGLELLKSIRTRGLATKVVVMTAANDPQMMRALAALHPDVLFHKPLDVAKLKRWLADNL